MSRAQTSIYILLGIVVLIGLSIILFVQSYAIDNKYIGADSSSLRFYVENCLSKVSAEGLYRLGMNGGYIDLTGKYVFEDDIITAYAYDQEIIYPGLSEMAVELAAYIDTNLILCVDDFSVFKQQGFDVSYNSPSSAITFTEDRVLVESKFPITIKKDSIMTLSDFNANLDVRFSRTYEYVMGILNCPVPYVDLTYLGDLDLDTYVLNYNSTQVYVLIDKKSILLSEPYKTIFAIK